MKKFKIVILGAGNVGSATTKALYDNFMREFPSEIEHIELCLVNRTIAKAKVIVRDIKSTSRENDRISLWATNNDADIKDAEIVIFVMGTPAGKTNAKDRKENLYLNLPIIDKYAAIIGDKAPSALIIVITNPVEAVTARFRQKVPNCKEVVGLGLGVDQNRFRVCLREKLLEIAPTVISTDIEVLAVGEHSQEGMLFVRQHLIMQGQQLELYGKKQGISKEEIDRIYKESVAETQQAGLKHVASTSNHEGACYAPAAIITEFVMAYVTKRELNTSAAICSTCEEIDSDEICIGLPLQVKDGNIVVRTVNLGETVTQQLRDTALTVRVQYQESFCEFENNLNSIKEENYFAPGKYGFFAKTNSASTLTKTDPPLLNNSYFIAAN